MRKHTTTRQPATPRLQRFIARFARAERGATAVEFAMISLPLMVLIFGVIELAMVLLVATTLETAVESAARTIRTGNFQTSASSTKADFKALVCGKMSWLSAKCATDLWVDVRTFNDFGSLAGNAPQGGSVFNPASTCFSPGQPADIVLVRAYFQWALFTPLLSNALEDMGGGSGKRLLSFATAFRNEPFNSNPPSGAAC
jgi:Flp pilus assembly protein TadG